MRRVVWLVLILWVQALLAQTSQEAGNGSIEGIVISLSNNQPVEDVRVTLTPRDGGDYGPFSAPSVTPIATGVDGKFAFSGLKAGTYRLEFAGNGYARQQHG
jgi:hypothetical protein